MNLDNDEKPRRGRKKGSKNKPKVELHGSDVKVEVELEIPETTLDIKTIKTEKDMENSIKIEILNDNDQLEKGDEPPKKKRGRKKKSEMTEEPVRIVKRPGESEYRKKNKEYDDEIAQFLRLRCELCLTDCDTFADIKRHYRTSHNRRGYVTCCTTRKFYKRVFLYEHIQKHKNPDTFK